MQGVASVQALARVVYCSCPHGIYRAVSKGHWLTGEVAHVRRAAPATLLILVAAFLCRIPARAEVKAPHTTGSLPSTSTRSLFPNGRTGSPGPGDSYQQRYHFPNGHQPSPLAAFSPAVDGFRPQYAARAVAAGVPAFELG